jgi:ribosome biogenesis GTPase A
MSKLPNQHTAFLLAAVNCVSDKVYDKVNVSSYLLHTVINLFRTKSALQKGSVGDYAAPDFIKLVKKRYDVEFYDKTTRAVTVTSGEILLHKIAHKKTHGDIENAAQMILQDFREGRLGGITLEVKEIVERREREEREKFEERVRRDEEVDKRDLRKRDRPVVRREDLDGFVEKAEEKGVVVPEGEGAKGAFDGW